MKLKIILLASAILMLVSLSMIFVFVPTEAQQGVIQRIFYFHVPVAWVAFFAFFVTFVAGVGYLIKRNLHWDTIASISAEIGLVFTTLILITGSIWARPIWGVWWTWDARLTASLVLWLIYLSYFILRAYISEDERRARFSAVVGIVGFIDVPIVAFAINFANTAHPSAGIFSDGMDGRMLLTLLLSIAAFTVMYLLFMMVGIQLRKNEQELKILKEAMKE